MKKKVSFSTTVCLMIIAACVTAFALLLTLILTDSIVIGSGSKWYSKLKEIDRLVEKNYYYELGADELTDYIAAGYMYGLGDQYAAYYNADDTDEVQQSNRGNMVGIGVTVISDDGKMYVYQVDPNGPAAASGIKPGDYIVRINGGNVEENGFDEIYERMEGEVGSLCAVTVRRGDKLLDFTVTRAEFEITTVYYRLIEKSGYLKITRFNDKTADQIISAIETLRESGAENIIFDLRHCGGGLVTPTAKALDYLLPEGNIISATYAGGRHKVLHTSDSDELDMPMAVLTSGSTASAAELFSAAIRDYEKGVLIGTTTFGKGIMQHTYNLSDGSSVKFTTAEFQPPCGEGFDGVGVAPDITVELSENEEAHYYQLDETNDPQLIAALEYFK